MFTAAAIFRQEGYQRVDTVEIRGVDDETAFTARADHVGMSQLLHMERNR